MIKFQINIHSLQESFVKVKDPSIITKREFGGKKHIDMRVIIFTFHTSM